MCRRLLVAVTTLTALSAAGADGFAAGAPVRKAPVTVSPATTPAMSTPAMTAPAAPAVSAEPAAAPGGALFGGCGRGRVRDPHSGQCRGPADVAR